MPAHKEHDAQVTPNTFVGMMSSVLGLQGGAGAAGGAVQAEVFSVADEQNEAESMGVELLLSLKTDLVASDKNMKRKRQEGFGNAGTASKAVAADTKRKKIVKPQAQPAAFGPRGKGAVKIEEGEAREEEGLVPRMRARKQRGDSDKCEHGNEPEKCKDCLRSVIKGGEVCEHGRRRRVCKECGGSGICEHGRQKPDCRDCATHVAMVRAKHQAAKESAGGSAICEHGRRRRQCKECGGTSICEHGKRKSRCKFCGGSGICPHGRLKHQCKECGGSGICKHGRRKHQCKECGGSSICPHGRLKNRCKDCGGSSICEHGRQKHRCKDCGGSGICKHGRRKHRCKDCLKVKNGAKSVDAAASNKKTNTSVVSSPSSSSAGKGPAKPAPASASAEGKKSARQS